MEAAKQGGRAKSFGDVVSAILNGCFSTAGGILGDAVGAVIGGVGGAFISLGTKNAFEHLYKVTHRNWAFYFHKWGNKD